MSRIPALLQETVAELARVKQNIQEVQLRIQEKGDQPESALNSTLSTLVKQRDILEGIASKHAGAIANSQETGEDIGEEDIESEIVLRSQRILKTRVDTLEESETRTKTKFTYHETSCVAEVEMEEEGIRITGPNTLPLFIPIYINSFQFDDFESIIHAIAQVLEAYCRRSESVKKVEDKYKEILLKGYIEKDYPRSHLEFKLHISKQGDETASEFVEVKLDYSLSDNLAEAVQVHISGTDNEALLEKIRSRSEVFKQYHFFKAFENFIVIPLP